MEDADDVKKIEEVLIKSQEEFEGDDYDFDNFINYDDKSESENEFEELLSPSFNENHIINKYDDNTVLKIDEKNLIDNCKNDQIRNLMILNRNKNIQLILLHKQIKQALIECRDNLYYKEQLIEDLKQKKSKRNLFAKGTWRLGCPYFKDTSLFSHTGNSDSVTKSQNGELTSYDLLPSGRWTTIDMDKLIKAVKCNYNLNQQAKLHKQIEDMANSNGDTDEIDCNILKLKQKIDELKENAYNEVPEINNNDDINFERISAVFFNNKRSDVECKAMWNLYLHPDINKSKFSEDENKKLKSIVEKYDKQNWKKICEELNTSRTELTVCVHYFKNLTSKSIKRERFTQDEDDFLYSLVREYKIGDSIPWPKVARHFKHRSRKQLFYRYRYFLAQAGKCKPGRFTEEEDVLLMILVDKFGRNFKKCAEYFENRSNIQLKSRYNTNLCGALRKGTFSLEEDKQILEFVKSNETCMSWKKLSKIMYRSRRQLLQRYEVIKQYLLENPNCSIDDVIRKKHHYTDEADDNFHYLRYVADMFKNQDDIPNLLQIKMTLGRNKPITFYERMMASNYSTPVDELIIDYFSNSQKFKKSYTEVSSSAKVLNNVLDLLKVNLILPHNFDEDIRLDNVDVALLLALKDCRNIHNDSKKNTKKVERLIPPNFSTLTALRSLLIKHCSVVKTQKNPINILKKLQNTDSRQSSTLYVPELENIAQQKLFSQRFFSLFKFPAIMSLHTPKNVLYSTCVQYELKTTHRPRNMKTYAKKKQITSTVTSSSDVNSVETKPSALAQKMKERMAEMFENIDREKQNSSKKNAEFILGIESDHIHDIVVNENNRKRKAFKSYVNSKRAKIIEVAVEVDRSNVRSDIRSVTCDSIVERCDDIRSVGVSEVRSDVNNGDISDDIEDVKKLENVLLNTDLMEIDDVDL